MYPLALSLTKISLLFMYRRIFSISRRMRVIIVTTIVLVAAWMVTLFFAELFQCSTKFWANWGSSYDIRTQFNKTTMIVFAVCLTDSIFDLTILVMPIPLICPKSSLLESDVKLICWQIWQLRLSTGKKVGLLSIFLLGVVYVCSYLLTHNNPLTVRSTVTASLVRLGLVIPLVFTLYETDVNHRFGSFRNSYSMVIE